MSTLERQIRRTGPVLLLVVMGVMWGLQFAMIRLAALSGYSDLAVIAISLVLLALVFSVISVAKGEAFRPGARAIAFFFVTSCLGYLVPLTATLHAASALSAGLLSLFASLAPVAAIFFAILLRAEKVSPSRFLAVGLGVLSVAIVLLPELELPGRGQFYWMLAASVCPLSYGIESVYVKKFWPPGLSVLQVMTGETVAAALLAMPAFMLLGSPLPDAEGWADGETAILIFVAAGVVEGLIYFNLIKKTGAVFVNFGASISLFAGIAWGIVLFSETHLAITWVAAFVLAIAIFFASKRPASPVEAQK